MLVCEEGYFDNGKKVIYIGNKYDNVLEYGKEYTILYHLYKELLLKEFDTQYIFYRGDQFITPIELRKQKIKKLYKKSSIHFLIRIKTWAIKKGMRLFV